MDLTWQQLIAGFVQILLGNISRNKILDPNFPRRRMFPVQELDLLARLILSEAILEEVLDHGGRVANK